MNNRSNFTRQCFCFNEVDDLTLFSAYLIKNVQQVTTLITMLAGASLLFHVFRFRRQFQFQCQLIAPQTVAEEYKFRCGEKMSENDVDVH